jgi:hypothetical protein
MDLGVLGRIFGHKRVEVTGTQDNFIKRTFIIWKTDAILLG